MREVEVGADINSKIVEKSKNPFADEFSTLASDMIASMRASLDSGDISEIEAAGLIAMAAMCSLYASNSIPEKQMHSFLKSLAERKTPDPVQKVEQHSIVDMRVLVQSLIEKNPTALADATEKALVAKQHIVEKLQIAGDDFRMKGSDITADYSNLPEKADYPNLPEQGLATNPPAPTSLPHEPTEIQNIRAGRPPQRGIDNFRYFSKPNCSNLPEKADYPNLPDKEDEQ
jgi:hypothetical protein